MLAVNDQFPTMEDARKAMHRHVLDEGESYKVYLQIQTPSFFAQKKALLLLFLFLILIVQPIIIRISSHLLCGSLKTINEPLLSIIEP